MSTQLTPQIGPAAVELIGQKRGGHGVATGSDVSLAAKHLDCGRMAAFSETRCRRFKTLWFRHGRATLSCGEKNHQVTGFCVDNPFRHNYQDPWYCMYFF
jgi:hypothetical protein